MTETTKSDTICIISDFPDLWSNTSVPFREKKRMLRLLIEDVTLKNDQKVIANIRFRGGTCKTLFIDRKLPMCEVRKTRDDIIRQVDELTENHIPSKIAAILNQKGYHLYSGNMFNYRSVKYIIRVYGIKSRYQRLKEKGCLTLKEKMLETNFSQEQIMQMRNEGKIVFHKVTDRQEYLYEPQNTNKYLVKFGA